MRQWRQWLHNSYGGRTGSEWALAMVAVVNRPATRLSTKARCWDGTILTNPFSLYPSLRSLKTGGDESKRSAIHLICGPVATHSVLCSDIALTAVRHFICDE